MPTTTNIPAVLAQAQQGIPMTRMMSDLLGKAARGGEDTAGFFRSQSLVRNFTLWLNQLGEQAWIYDTDAAGNPVYFAVQMGSPEEAAADPRPVASHAELRALRSTPRAAGAPDYFFLELATHPDAAALSGAAPATGFDWDGQHYNVFGLITATFSFNQQPTWYVEAPVGVLELVPLAVLAKVAWANLVKPVLTSYWEAVVACTREAPETVGLEGLGLLADRTAAGAAVEGAVVAEDTTLSLVVGGLALAGVIVLVAIPFVLSAIAHPVFQTLNVYNLTPYDLHWQAAYSFEGVMSAGPVAHGQLNPLIPAMSVAYPPGLEPVKHANSAQLQWTSASDFNGLGYSLALVLSKPGDPTQVASGGAVFNVPWAAANLLGTSLTAGEGIRDYGKSFYEANQHGKEQWVASTQVEGKTLQLTATFDYLHGQHPSPSGQMMYTYNSLLVLSVES